MESLASTSRDVALEGRSHRITAEWCWPDTPLARIRLDGREVATVDYLPASASAHWVLTWISEELATDGPKQLPLMPLVTRVPEEVDAERSLRAAVLDIALDGTEARLTGRPVRP
jgi:hypothetical protein